jgi:hypothetical protein
MNENKSQVPVVITTINAYNDAIKDFAAVEGHYCLVVGDKKTPHDSYTNRDKVRYLSVTGQEALGFELVKHVPYNHYCRKNLGYLTAIQQGAQTIAESDDDNRPYDYWHADISKLGTASHKLLKAPRIANIYKFFSPSRIWPRGLPLDAIEFPTAPILEDSQGETVMIVQGLADKSPDVDAIHRLVFPDTETIFERSHEAIVLDQGVYCPFNSQNTLWAREAFCYLYLPMFVRFRFTDILRGFVAQRGIMALGGRLAFTPASVYQDRNVHNILRDFADELDCYLKAGDIIDLLDGLKLTGTATDDILTIYDALCSAGVVEKREVSAVSAWVKDIQSLNH